MLLSIALCGDVFKCEDRMMIGGRVVLIIGVGCCCGVDGGTSFGISFATSGEVAVIPVIGGCVVGVAVGSRDGVVGGATA